MRSESRLTCETRLMIARALASSHPNWDLVIMVDGHAGIIQKYRGLLSYGSKNYYEAVEIDYHGEYFLIEGAADHVIADQWLVEAFHDYVESLVELRAELIRAETRKEKRYGRR